MRRTLLIGAAALVGFLVIGGEWYLLARPMPQLEDPMTSPARTRPVQSRQAPSPMPVAAKPAATITPMVGMPSATPSLITVNTATTVTVTVQISPTPIANGVNLLRLGATGTQPTILGVMHDDGLNGDAVANDGIYTLQVPFNEAAAGQIQLQISAAFTGLLKRLTSSLLSVPIDNIFRGSTFHFLYAPDLNLATSNSIRPDVQSSYTLSNSGLQTSVTVTIYSNPSSLQLSNWYAQVLEGNEYSGTFSGLGSAVASIHTVSCNGAPGLLVDGNVFGYQAARLFCATSLSVVEFEATSADGDPPPDSDVLQFASLFFTP